MCKVSSTFLSSNPGLIICFRYKNTQLFSDNFQAPHCAFYLIMGPHPFPCKSDTSECAIIHNVHHCNVKFIQNCSTMTNMTMEPYCIILQLTLPCRTMSIITNSLMSHIDSPYLRIIFPICIYSYLFFISGQNHSANFFPYAMPSRHTFRKQTLIFTA